MDDIQGRLKETSETCVASYAKWATDKKDGDVRATLQEAIHELRKVASRLEIEMAISERDENALKKIPIPSHRAQGRGHQSGDDDNRGNSAAGNSAPPARTSPKPQRNRGKPKRNDN
ncbi:MAG: hypothetical protein DHS20C02_01970 [Micavibrio sp.]|nr:MAG: hypothetical protein DHS20C02_01970 [Micavibrio sp.]